MAGGRRHGLLRLAAARTAVTEPETILVPAGEAGLGDPPQPVHLSPFAIAPASVTAAEYAAFAAATGHPGRGDAAAGDLPVTGISWADAIAYCRWLTRESGRTYRLPDEREWEKAARAGVLRLAGTIPEWTNTWSAEQGARVLRGAGSLTARRTDPAGAGFRVVHSLTGR